MHLYIPGVYFSLFLYMTQSFMGLKSILIVDDSTSIADRLQTMLIGLDGIGRIGHAEDYSSAVALLAETGPDIVLLDINLHGKSGIALLQYIKFTYPSTVVIMITNQGGEYYRRICKQFGADFFVD